MLRTEAAQGQLLERGTELEAVAAAIAVAARGDGVVIALEGPAGIGKTRVMDCARAAAGDAGLRVLAARGGELERDFAYGVVRQLFERAVLAAPEAEREVLLDGAARHAGAALGASTRGSQEEAAEDQSFAVVHGLYWLVANLAAAGPLMLAIDDVQWSDAPSLRFLGYLSRRLDGLPVILAVAARTGDPSADDATLTALLADPSVQRITPPPLSTAATSELLAVHLDAEVDAEFAAACHSATGGNPFLVHELALALGADDIAPVASNAQRVARLGPSTVARSLVLRLSRLSPDGVALARAVAVLGASADARQAAAVAGLTEAAAAEAVDALVNANILARERPLRYTHPILREAVYNDLPLAERDGLHAKAADHLASSGSRPSQVAAHLLATPPLGSADTVIALRAAASDALSQGAADVAVRHLRRALDEPPAPEDRPAILAELGHAEWLAGQDPMAAVEHLRAALDATEDAVERVDLAIRLTRATFSTGDLATAIAVLEAELAVADGLPYDAVMRLEAELGSVSLVQGVTPERAERIESFASLPGDTITEQLVLCNTAARRWLNGTAASVVEAAERALGDGRLVDAVGSDSIAVLEVAWCLIYAEEFALADATLDATIAIARRTNSVFGLSASYALRSMSAWRQGDIVRAEVEARNGIDLPGLPPFSHPAIHTWLGLALVERGSFEEAEDVFVRSWVGPYLPVLVITSPAFYGRGLLRLMQGRHAEALEDFLELGRRDEQLAIANPGAPWRLGAARAYNALGEPDRALELADEHLVFARHWGTTGGIGVSLQTRGVVRGGAEGIADLEEAVATLARSDGRLVHAKALLELGIALRVAGQRSRARAALAEAETRARRCGATATVRRAHAELQTAGAKPRKLQFSGLESLTASERRVCDLAAGGRSNRDIAQELFVTPKTVENHLGRAYAKLGISSRDELPEALADD